MIDGLHPTEVVLHLHPDAGLPQRFGRRILEAGGKYSDVRGASTLRFVHLPVTGDDDLLDELVRSYPTRGGTLMLASRVAAPGIDDHRVNMAFKSPVAPQVRFARSDPRTPSSALRRAVHERNLAIDWAQHRARWDGEDGRRETLRAVEAAHCAETAVAEAALALLDGTGDVEAVLAAARTLRGLRIEAGIEAGIDQDEAAEAPGPAPR